MVASRLKFGRRSLRGDERLGLSGASPGIGGSAACRFTGGVTGNGLPSLCAPKAARGAEFPLPERRCSEFSWLMVGLCGLGVSCLTADGLTNSAIGDGGVMFGGRPCVTNDMDGGWATAAAAMFSGGLDLEAIGAGECGAARDTGGEKWLTCECPAT